MKKTLLAITSALVLAGAMSTTASAQSNGYPDRGGASHPSQRDSDRHDNRNDQGDNRHMAHKRYHAASYRAPRNYRDVRYNVGNRLPSGYYGGSYYVDYRPYGLSAPPRGYRWNRVGNDVYLVSTTNGLIRDVIYSLFQ
jgi:Ni/Co efflux regulator RcnB